MTFLQPAAFWTAAAIPLIVLLYLLKKKTRPQPVSSIMLWERLDQTASPSLRLSRLLRSLLLLLQLLGASLLTLALVQPALPLNVGGSPAGHTVVIIDTSYSMAVQEDGKTRLEQAQQFLRDRITRKATAEALAVVAMAGKARVICGFTSDTATLLEAVGGLAIDGGRANLQEALVLAEDLTHDRDDTAVMLISAGGCDEVALRLGAPFSFIPVGENPVRNLLIAAMIADGERLYVTVYNNGTLPARGTVRIEDSAGTPVGQREVSLEPGNSTVLTWREIAPSPWYRGEVLAGGDQVSWDDSFYAVTAGGAAGSRLLLVGEGNLFLERVLQLQPGLAVTRVRPAGYRPEFTGRYDYFIFDGYLPETLPAAPLLIFDPPHPNPHFETTAPFRPDRLQTAAHSLMAYADFNAVTLSYAKVIRGGRPLLQTAEGNIGVELERKGMPIVVFGFAVQGGDLPLRPAFPVLIRNTIDYFTGLTMVPGRLSYGEPLFLDPPWSVETVEVLAPGGDRRRISGPFPYRGEPVRESGIYTISTGERDYLVAVNTPATTGTLAAVDCITIAGAPVSGSRQTPGLLSLATPLLLATCFLIGLEWWVDNRGY